MNDPLSDIARAAEDAAEAPDLAPAGEAPNRKHLDSYVIPPDAPIQCLGHLRKVLYFLDVDGQLLEMAPKLPKEDIVYLFRQSISWIETQDHLAAWKAVGMNKATGNPIYEKNGFDQRKVQEALVRECGRKGLMDIAGKVRGRGSHRDAAGQLVLHCGDKILRTRVGAKGEAKTPEWQAPGLVGKLIFPTGPALPHPAKKPATAADGRALLSILSLWIWQGSVKVMVGEKAVPIEALLLLGWIGNAKNCGAVNWRSHVWLIGPSGSGKSTLQALISRLLAEWALESQDPSEAWISQSLADQRLPVLYDEPEPAEGEDGGNFVRKVIKLARLASTGGKRGRGSQDHKAVDFAIYSSFLFSSIMHHQLEAQDRNRMAILALSKFPPGTLAMDVDAIERLLETRWGIKGSLQELGLALSRRLVEQWPRYAATLGAYQAELMRARVDPREQSTYGELLAAADMMLFDDAPAARQDVGDPNPPAGDHERAGRLVQALLPLLAVAETQTENLGERVLGRLTGYRLSSASGKHQETVGRWIEKAMVSVLLGELGTAEAKDKLKAHGMMLVHVRPRRDEKGKEWLSYQQAYLDPDAEAVYLAVAGNNAEGLKQIFHGTVFKGGEWRQALDMVSGALKQGAKVRYGGTAQWSSLVPIGELIDVEAARQEAHERGLELATREDPR